VPAAGQARTRANRPSWKDQPHEDHQRCYVVYGKNEKGSSVEPFFHPKNFELVTAP
jgi:hypothetical protein